MDGSLEVETVPGGFSSVCDSSMLGTSSSLDGALDDELVVVAVIVTAIVVVVVME